MVRASAVVSKSQRAYHHVRERITDGTLPPGYRLVLGQVAAELDDTEYQRAMQVLSVVEGAATALSAPYLGAADLQRARSLNAEMAACLDDLDPRRSTELNRGFHALLCGACPNAQLLELVERGWDRPGVLRWPPSSATSVRRGPGWADWPCASYTRSPDALRSPDESPRRRAMVEHPATTLDDWTALSPAERVVLVERSRELARATSATHGTWTGLAEPAGGEPARGPLSGVAISVKDNVDVRGLATTAGSPLLASAPVEVDAGAVSALRAAGAVVVGKTNMHELALGITSDNATHGPARNPADPSRSAGGSSGGSAASVALGVVPVALGSDTGGSVTIPASFCGVVGYRPSTGRWSGDGVVNLSTTRDTVGVHAWTVADARRVDEVITHAPATTAPLRAPGLRLGVPRSRHADLDPEVARLTGDALAALEAAGAQLVEVDVPDDLAVGAEEGRTLVFYEAPRLLRARLAAQGSPDATAPLADLAARVASPDVRALVELMAARPITAQAYAAARAARWRLQRDHAATFARHGLDALVWPTVPVLPPLVGETTVALNGRDVPVFATVTRNTGPGAVSGLPCVSVPAGGSEGGLPVGLSVEGRARDDDHLLRVAATVEGVLARRPR